MLRLLGGRLLIMDRLHKVGICSPSRCFGCLTPSPECVNHVFCTGDIAKLVWGLFEVMVGVFSTASTVRHKLINWWLKLVTGPYLRYIVQLLPSLICWNL